MIMSPNLCCPSDEKHSRELQTMEYLTQTLLTPSNPKISDEIMSLWQEYENGSTPEAIFVKDGMDLVHLDTPYSPKSYLANSLRS